MANRQPPPTAARRRSLFRLVATAAILGATTHTIYTPSLGAARAEFDTSFTLIGTTIGAYGLALALAQVGYGPLADLFSARRLLASGLVLYLLANLACYAAPTIELFIVARAVQAVGVAGATVIGAALIVDLFPPRERGKALGTLQTFNATGGATGFILGSLVLAFAPWRASFLVLTVLGAVVLLGVLLLVPAAGLRTPHFSWREVGALVRAPAVLGAATGAFCHMYAIFTFQTILPVVLREKLAIPEVWFAPFFLTFPLGVTVGAPLGGRLSDRLGRRTVCLLGLVIGTAVCGVYALLVAQPLSLASAVVLAALQVAFAFSLGFAAPAQMALSVEWFPSIRGTAVGVVTAIRFGGSALGPTLSGLAVDSVGEPWAAFALGTAVMAVGLALSWRFVREAPRAAMLASGARRPK